MSVIAPTALGFGGYPLLGEQTFPQMQVCAKVQKIFLSIFFSALTAISIAIIPASLPIGVAALVGFSYLAVRSILAAVGAFYRAKPMQNFFPNEVEASLPPLNTVSERPCSGFATRDSVESHEWKLNLIRAAKHTIFLSGCYCGGIAFDEALDLIRDQMRTHPNLKTSILSSNMFITSENEQRMREMEAEFGSRFKCIVTLEVFPYLSPATGSEQLCTQHTKALVIDYGAAFLLGGSGMITPWSKQRGEEVPTQIEKHGIFYDHILTLKAYRDMDFVFQSPELNGIGTRIHVEMTKLFERFRFTDPEPPFTGWPERVDPIAFPRQIDNLKLACYTSGPEQGDTAFLDELIRQVENAESSIWIGHMYFHPPARLLKALIDASNRGVHITLVTNKLEHQSPGCHWTHAELTRYYAKALFEGRRKPNIEHYEFNIPYTSYHKKVVVIDEKTTLLGSTNIGKKSLEACDYEINVKVNSPAFAAASIQSLEQDKEYCMQNVSRSISLETRVLSTIQSLFVPFL
jgi:hypothetical protein